MREKLRTYIDYLFAGAPATPATAETKAEILQNTLDKYDDMIAQGKTPEAAYSLAVAGIGDIGELLSGESHTARAVPAQGSAKGNRGAVSAILLAVAVMLYITCVVPVILFDGKNLAVCAMFVMIAAATGLLIYRANLAPHRHGCGGEDDREPQPADSPRVSLRKSINGAISAVSLALYLIISFTTRAWYITWVIFPLTAAVESIVKACFELKE